MDVSELRQLLSRPEWADVEIKTSARAFPKDAASSMCAFANCGGGYLILGVDEKKLPLYQVLMLTKLMKYKISVLVCLRIYKNLAVHWCSIRLAW